MILQSMIRAAFGQGSISLFITANATNVNLFSLVTPTPTAPVNVNVTVNAGVTIGATGSNYALDIGAFPSGSKVTLDVYGSIQGVGGAANGGVGGSCIYADRSGVQVTINLKSGGTIYAGGGGGGRGGNGGTGGTGGQGYYVATNWQYNGSSYVWAYSNTVLTINGDPISSGWAGYWNGSLIGSGGGNPASYGIYRRGSYVTSGSSEDPGNGTTTYTDYYYIGQDYNVFTSGGAGGGGGAGGNGGRGQGYDGANAAGVSGGSGSAGAAGGTNAGQGGTGGVGGSGGSGGTWGNSGNTGATGVGGGTGASGNYTAGSAGSAGAGGSSGGLAGYYLYKGTNSANVTFTNAGTVAGRLG